MALEITGTLWKVQAEQTGAGKNGNWVKQDFIIETEDQFPKKVCITAWGEKADELKKLKLGERLKVAFNVESREYNERWYTDIKAWKIDRMGAGAASNDGPPAPFGEERDFAQGSAADIPMDELPF